MTTTQKIVPRTAAWRDEGPTYSTDTMRDRSGLREDRLKVAIVHEWFETYSGSERVVGALLRCFPQANIFSIVDFMPERDRAFLGGRNVKCSFIQKLPFARRRFRAYLGLMPFAVEQFDLSGYDLILSSSHAVAKGVLTGPDQLHISYVHSPMRYAWDLQHQYLKQANLVGGVKSLYARWLLSRLRIWDVRTAAGVDVFVANSTYIARRIRKVYRRNSAVIHPPVDVASFHFCPVKSDYYLVVSRQVPYKRVDLIAAAFALMPNREIIIVGDGPEHETVKAAARNSPNITFLPPISSKELVGLMQAARALVVAAEEDFGITTVEAQACGTPVVAYGKGGAVDIINTGGVGPATGVMFQEQTIEAVVASITEFESLCPPISPIACYENAKRFGLDAFHSRMSSLVEASLISQ